jgi:type IX secretion system PorP/SprF family membrane protein
MRGFGKILLFAIFVLAIIVKPKEITAQQDPMYTQYMDNLLVINAGFAGSKENGNFLLVARNQWVSFPGAPFTRSFSYNTPLKGKNVGLGFSVMYDKIGPQIQTGVYFDYSYFLK